MTTEKMLAIVLVANAVFLVCLPVLHGAVVRWRNRK